MSDAYNSQIVYLPTRIMITSTLPHGIAGSPEDGASVYVQALPTSLDGYFRSCLECCLLIT